MQRAEARRALIAQMSRGSAGGLVHTTREVVTAVLGLTDTPSPSLGQLLDEAVRLLHAHLDAAGDGPCRLDHHGACQEHSCAIPCEVAATRVFLEENKL